MAGSLYRQCARMFMVGFPGPFLDVELERLIAAGVFGAVLFRRNLGTAGEIAELCRSLKSRAGRPFLLAADQEGGRVARLRGAPFTAIPSMRSLGLVGDEALLHRVGRLLAFELGAVGLDWDFAPVLDLGSDPSSTVIGDRALHASPEVVARLGVALARGLEAGGVASCAKHFPGHGATPLDSHLTLPRIHQDLELLRATALAPFRAYASAGLAAVMTAHVVYEGVTDPLPATLSPVALQTLLRRELGFTGLAVSDDLEMRAITEHAGIDEAVELGALAGIDLFLVCVHAERQERAIEALVHAVERGRVPRARIEEANQRLEVFSQRFCRPASRNEQLLGSPSHRALAQGLEGGGEEDDPTELLGKIS